MDYRSFSGKNTGAPDGSVPPNICFACKFLLAGSFEENDVFLGRKVLLEKLRGGRGAGAGAGLGDLLSRIPAMWNLSVPPSPH